MDGAGRRAQRQVAGQLEGVGCSGAAGTLALPAAGTDGLWARLRGGSQRALLILVDSVSGLLCAMTLHYPPVVAAEEESAEGRRCLLTRAQEAGLDLQTLRGLTSDGAHGLMAYLRESLRWVNQQRCVWHVQ